jgi:hypothetical protein
MNLSPRRRIARRVGAAVMALAAVLTLGACKATGGGYLDEPLQGNVIPPGVPLVMDVGNGVYQGTANFGFNYTCEMSTGNRAVIKIQITYHDSGTSTITVPTPLPTDPAVKTFPEIRIQGTVDPLIIYDVSTCEAAAEVFLDAALFEGSYRPQDTTLSAMGGRFNLLVYDESEPGRSPGEITGDGFAIELTGPPPYGGYTRGGYIEGGNIQVDS